MKNSLLFTILLVASNLAFGQSIPNGDFESWTTKAYYSPDSGWYTSNVQSLSKEDSLTVWKVPGSVGQAIHIQTAIVGTDTLQAYISNTAGDPTRGQGGMPYSQKPTALTGYYKCNVIAGDTGGIIVIFKKAGAIIGTPAQLAFIGNVSTYTAFSVPITLGVTPDSMIIAATSSNLLNNNIGLQSGSWLELDQLAFTGPGITQGIVNGSFDSWSATSSDKPNGWQSGSSRNTTNVGKTTDHYSGSYALMLQTEVGGSNPSVAEVTTGQVSDSFGPRGGLPYTKMTDTLTGYYKYTTSGTDTGHVFLYVSKSGVNIGGNSYNCLPTSTWTYFQIPFSASITPDSLRVDIVSSSWTSAVPGSTLYIDKLQLKSQPLSINHVNSGVGFVSIYPNPVGDVLHLNLNNNIQGDIELRLYNVTGKLVLSNNYTPTNNSISVPVSQLAGGVYFYEIKNNGIVISDKFVKQ